MRFYDAVTCSASVTYHFFPHVFLATILPSPCFVCQEIKRPELETVYLTLCWKVPLLLCMGEVPGSDLRLKTRHTE
jgi:hypothetical protein